MKPYEIALLVLVFPATAVMLGIGERALGFTHSFLSVLIAGALTSSLGSCLWRRRASATLQWRVLTTLSLLALALGVVTMWLTHVMIGWFGDLVTDQTIIGICNVLISLEVARKVWRATPSAERSQ